MKLFILLISGAILIILIGLAKFPIKGSMENLVMPGPLAQSHASYENQCAQCHANEKNSSQRSLCLNCHKDIAQDIKEKDGYHGRFESIALKDCSSCHQDHKGRSFDMVRLDKETFRHEFTGFVLQGAHERISMNCNLCHFPDKTYRAAPQNCFGCHAKDDRHNGKLGQQCADCHNVNSWKETYFNHNKTNFPLTGKHRSVRCSDCHTNDTYKNTPEVCAACHIVNDIHDSPPNERCDKCHNTESWKKVSFDHNRETNFILQGRHAQLACNACHESNIFSNKVGSKCVDCHQVDDVHKGKNGNNCSSCHNNTAWKAVSFDHNRDTQFKLLGQHAKLECNDCHKVSSKNMKINTSCYSCHLPEDVHKGQEGLRCQTCHNENGWRDNVKFDHDLTRFPLIGQHAAVSCTECHQSSAFKGTAMACIDCHRKDDYHHQTLGTNCGMCHNPNGWKFWRFDHNTQTKYKLEGAHEGLKCQSCHKIPVVNKIVVSAKCYDCHQDDDIHRGQFGTNCGQCHWVDSFKKYTIKKGM